MPPAFRIGVDENGLGPRLGPLIVTAVLARVTDDGRALAGRRPKGALARRLGDSKAMVSHRDVALGEAWARAVAARMGAPPRDPDELVAALSLEPRASLRAECPPHVEAQCWGAGDDPFEATDETLGAVERDLARLSDQGIDVVAATCAIVCTHRLNRGREQGLSRFDVDLHSMERVVLALAERAGAPVEAVCGKVGGYARYSGAFGPLAGRLHSVVEEGPARSAYVFPGLGELAFVRDADASDLVVAMASMIGKWMREALMGKIVAFYARATGEAFDASGYHDPVTARFVEATSLVRRERRVPDRCFERAQDAGAAKRSRVPR